MLLVALGALLHGRPIFPSQLNLDLQRERDTAHAAVGKLETAESERDSLAEMVKSYQASDRDAARLSEEMHALQVNLV